MTQPPEEFGTGCRRAPPLNRPDLWASMRLPHYLDLFQYPVVNFFHDDLTLCDNPKRDQTSTDDDFERQFGPAWTANPLLFICSE